MYKEEMVNGKWSDDKCYDLSGRRIGRVPQRGLYIQGGRTYLSR